MSSTKMNTRIDFGKIKHLADAPDLLDIQIASFREFFQLETTPDKRNIEGLFRVFKDNFPITDTRNIFVLEFLDYFIDLAEDRAFGDLNFVAYYQDEAQILTRLTHFLRQSLAGSRHLAQPAFAETVIYGLLAMYLSDPKANAPPEKTVKSALLATAGGYARFLHNLCRLLRRRRIL